MLLGVPPRVTVTGASSKQTEDYWFVAQRLLRQMGILSRLVQFDWQAVTEEQLARVEAIMADEELQPEALKRKSKAVASLATWVRGIVMTSRVHAQMASGKVANNAAIELARAEKEALCSDLTHLRDAVTDTVV